MTVIVIWAVLERPPALAVSWRTYVPDAEKLAVVLVAFTLPKVTVPGPLTSDHVVVNVPLELAAVPLKFADAGKVMV